jgi:ABC transport system ATP-binding/permease protein
MALFSMRGVSIGFGGSLVLDQIELQIERRERLGLVGRNGVGKSTLLKIIAGLVPPDEGDVVREQGLRVAYLSQEVPDGTTGTVAGIVSQVDNLRAHAPAEEEWQLRVRVDTILTRMSLDPEAQFETLSAGLKRRVLLAKGLVQDPEIVLLDEPTNHLDVDTIAWLEEFLATYSGTLVFVTHDRSFLRRLSTRIIEIDRGRLIDWACDYDTFASRKQAILRAETVQAAEFDKKLAQEEQWIRQGIEARRTRNEGRVRNLQKLRAARQERREQPGQLKVLVQDADRSGKLVIEAKNVSYRYDDRQILSGFSTTILRGDKVGIIGPNGSGKTTLLRILLGELAPQTGSIRQGANLSIAYFDQLRAQLDDNLTVLDNVADGNDFVTINGRRRHINGYLADFLFPTERAQAYVSTLSGGERNRLLLARLFARPANLLVMDEPTNDLDLETLDVLEERLGDFDGTLLLVSHDRELLNNVVTSTLALEGDGSVGEYAGGYDDWIRQRPAPVAPNAGPKKGIAARPRADRASKPVKLTYKEQRELEKLPGEIEALETEQRELYALLGDPVAYQQRGAEIAAANQRLAEIEILLTTAYDRWTSLESLAGEDS